MHDLILFAAGIIVGSMNAIAGGGMLIGFPILVAMGVPPLVANATNGLIVLPGNVAATWANRRYFKKIPRSYLLMLIPVTIGTVIGTGLLVRTPAESFEQIVPCLIAFAVLLFALQPFLHEYLRRHIHGSAHRRKQIRPIIITSLAIIPMAIYAGYFGAGFGFIILAFLGFTGLHDHLHRMNALKSVIVLSTALVAVLSLAHSGLIDWRNGLIMGAGGLIGGYTASIWSRRVSPHAIRMIVVMIGVGAAMYLAFRNFV